VERTAGLRVVYVGALRIKGEYTLINPNEQHKVVKRSVIMQ
jgi:hypothetical protein